MGGFYNLGVFASLSLLASPGHFEIIPSPAALQLSAIVQRQRLKALAAAPARSRRSCNAPTKRKLKGNRLITSKRVRRKHRRAA